MAWNETKWHQDDLISYGYPYTNYPAQSIEFN
jgi:hypothetical protein